MGPKGCTEGTAVDGGASRVCCHDLAYASQSETQVHRAITRVQKLRMRLGGSANLLDPFPGRPRGMHWRTYRRLRVAARAAEYLMVALDIEWLRKHFDVTLDPRSA